MTNKTEIITNKEWLEKEKHVTIYFLYGPPVDGCSPHNTSAVFIGGDCEHVKRQDKYWLAYLDQNKEYATCSASWFLSLPAKRIANIEEYEGLLEYMQSLNYKVTVVQDKKQAHKILRLQGRYTDKNKYVKLIKEGKYKRSSCKYKNEKEYLTDEQITQGWVDLSGVNLSYTNLLGVELDSADLRFTNLQGANLCYTNMRSADMRGVDLSSANICKSNLSNANIIDADLRYSNFYQSCLDGAALWDTDLTGANLNRVSIFGAHLSTSNLEGVSLYKSRYNSGKPVCGSTTEFPKGFNPEEHKMIDRDATVKQT